MKRYGYILRIKADCIEKYTKYHNEIWPEVLEALQACNLKNYSIYNKDLYLFSCYEYHGNDFNGDMNKLGCFPRISEWNSIMNEMQEPIETRKTGEWWAEMEEVFHLD